MLGLVGCVTDVDSPFAGISAGGTGSVTASGPSSDATANTSSGDDSEGATSTGDGTSSTDPGSTTEPAVTATDTTGVDPCDPDPCVAPQTCVDGACVGATTPGPGDVVITELQPDPDLVTDEAGEWFELLNVSAAAVELSGCELADQGTDSHTIATSVVIPPGGYAVLGRNAAANGGVTLDYVHGGDITLGNSGDELALRCDGVVIDEVVYTGSWPFGSGASMQLDPAAGAVNDAESAWCESTTPYGDGDLGSPGSANAPC